MWVRPTLAKGLSVSDSTSWAYALLVVLLASPVLAAVVVLVTTVGQTESGLRLIRWGNRELHQRRSTSGLIGLPPVGVSRHVVVVAIHLRAILIRCRIRVHRGRQSHHP
ncbi:MAG: hypothetical protein EBT47_13770 [Chloroflexi bacterium]|nr:hypothetical protein [Chloroflexota bacterium]